MSLVSNKLVDNTNSTSCPVFKASGMAVVSTARNGSTVLLDNTKAKMRTCGERNFKLVLCRWDQRTSRLSHVNHSGRANLLISWNFDLFPPSMKPDTAAGQPDLPIYQSASSSARPWIFVRWPDYFSLRCHSRGRRDIACRSVHQ